MSKTGLILTGVLVLGVLAVTNTALFVTILPFLLFLACPLMHFLMPGMHGGHGEHGAYGQKAEPGAQQFLPSNEGHVHHAATAAGAQRETLTRPDGGTQ
jgi:hypothetical protein